MQKADQMDRSAKQRALGDQVRQTAGKAGAQVVREWNAVPQVSAPRAELKRRRARCQACRCRGPRRVCRPYQGSGVP
ncbi:hypothetical protein PSEUDO9AG_41378 [Pseudomonas sp. 9Ag]|nr:hypothetical protein PSEUDO9AG_41378 [Pseudomonas sp. 9Ag]